MSSLHAAWVSVIRCARDHKPLPRAFAFRAEARTHEQRVALSRARADHEAALRWKRLLAKANEDRRRLFELFGDERPCEVVPFYRRPPAAEEQTFIAAMMAELAGDERRAA